MELDYIPPRLILLLLRLWQNSLWRRISPRGVKQCTLLAALVVGVVDDRGPVASHIAERRAAVLDGPADGVVATRDPALLFQRYFLPRSSYRTGEAHLCLEVYICS